MTALGLRKESTTITFCKTKPVTPFLPFCPSVLPFSHWAHCFPHSFSSALSHVCGRVWWSCQYVWFKARCIEGNLVFHFTGHLFSLCLFWASAFLQSSPNWSNHVPANTMRWIVSPSFHFFLPLSLSPTSVFLFNCWLFEWLGSE